MCYYALEGPHTREEVTQRVTNGYAMKAMVWQAQLQSATKAPHQIP